jgi:hypothetical protein
VLDLFYHFIHSLLLDLKARTSLAAFAASTCYLKNTFIFTIQFSKFAPLCRFGFFAKRSSSGARRNLNLSGGVCQALFQNFFLTAFRQELDICSLGMCI